MCVCKYVCRCMYIYILEIIIRGTDYVSKEGCVRACVRLFLCVGGGGGCRGGV